MSTPDSKRSSGGEPPDDPHDLGATRVESNGTPARRRMARLASLIVDLADDAGRIDRGVLREEYASHSRPSEPRERSFVDTNPLMKRKRNVGQTYRAATTGTTLKKKSQGRGSSDTLSKDLVALERTGAIVRVGENVVVVRDWAIVAAVIRSDSLLERERRT